MCLNKYYRIWLKIWPKLIPNVPSVLHIRVYYTYMDNTLINKRKAKLLANICTTFVSFYYEYLKLSFVEIKILEARKVENADIFIIINSICSIRSPKYLMSLKRFSADVKDIYIHICYDTFANETHTYRVFIMAMYLRQALFSKVFAQMWVGITFTGYLR